MLHPSDILVLDSPLVKAEETSMNSTTVQQIQMFEHKWPEQVGAPPPLQPDNDNIQIIPAYEVAGHLTTDSSNDEYVMTSLDEAASEMKRPHRISPTNSFTLSHAFTDAYRSFDEEWLHHRNSLMEHQSIVTVSYQ